MVTIENPPPEVALGPWSETRPTTARDYAPAALVALAFIPILILFSTELWSRPHYQFFPLVVPGAAALVWKACRRLGPLVPGDRAIALALAGIGWTLLALGVALITPWFAAIGLLVTLLGVIFALGGTKLVRSTLPAWAFLWLAIPPPRRYDYLMIAKLQDVVSRWSSDLLDLAGVYHVMDGNVVEVAGRELLVDQACSGIYSLFTLLIGTLFYALWMRTSPARAVVLLAASVFWVLFGNVIRIVTVVVLATRWNINAVSGWKHEALGLVMFVVMLAMVLSTDRLTTFVVAVFQRLRWAVTMSTASGRARASRLAAESSAAQARNAVRPKPQTAADPTAEPGFPTTTDPDATVATESEPVQASTDTTVVPPVGRTWMGSWPLAAAFGVLFLPQLVMPGVHWKDVLLASDVYHKIFSTMDKGDMFAASGPFRQADFRTERRDWDNSWGEHSRVWSYSGLNRSLAVSLDYQFVEWHELTICYKSRGWTMIGRASQKSPKVPAAAGGAASADSAAAQAGDDGSVVVADFVDLEGHHGFLVYGMYDRKGRPLDPPDTLGTLDLLRERLASWVKSTTSGGRDGELVCYQLQTFVRGDAPPTVEERAAIFDAFARARQITRDRVLKMEGGKS